jgi:alpha-ribazole phosphatase/probable phosphoglycerate mutase
LRITTVDLLRHGEAAPGLCLGRAFDAPLTATGWAQMRAVAAGGVIPWDGIVSSPLRRCAAYAEELAAARALPLNLEPRWRELGFGAWEGRPWSELYQENGDALLAFQRDPLSQDGEHPAAGGEHYRAFETRIAAAWADLLARAQGGHWLLVAHGGVLRAVLRQVLGFSTRRLFGVQVPNACLTRIEQQDGGSVRLVFHGGRLS